MKLLFDQNLSNKLCASLKDLFPGSIQVRTARLDRTNDSEIWQYAFDHGFTIVTMDSDFAEMVGIHGFPPKIIWLRCS